MASTLQQAYALVLIKRGNAVRKKWARNKPIEVSYGRLHFRIHFVLESDLSLESVLSGLSLTHALSRALPPCRRVSNAAQVGEGTL